MFIYEKDGKLNFMVADNKPAKNDETPNITIGPDNNTPVGAEVTINGKAVKTGEGGDDTLDLTCFKYRIGYEGDYDYYTDTPPDNWESLDAGTLFNEVRRECNLPEGLEQKIVACYTSLVNGDDSLVKQITALMTALMFHIDDAAWEVYPGSPYTISITGYSIFDGEEDKGLTFINHNDEEDVDVWYTFAVNGNKVTRFWTKVQW